MSDSDYLARLDIIELTLLHDDLQEDLAHATGDDVASLVALITKVQNVISAHKEDPDAPTD